MRKSRSELIGELILKHAFSRICEIGVSRGDNARGIRDWLKVHKYHLDKFYGVEPGEWGKDNKLFKPDPERLNFHGFHLITETSDNALKQLPTQLDLVFIDGDHSPEQIEKDILGYTPKIKNGGILVGDDYNELTGKSIKEVVNKVIGANNINVQLDTRLESGHDNYLWWTYIVHDLHQGKVVYKRDL